MNERTLKWIERINEEHNISPNIVLDIGSRHYNSNPRYLFPNSKYVGIDILDGDNVDEVVDAYRLSSHFREKYFDAVLCLNVFEHTVFFWKILLEIDFVLKSGGYFYVSMPSFGYPRHDYPSDYWRMTEDAMREGIMKGYDILSLEVGKTKYGKHPMIDCLGIKT